MQTSNTFATFRYLDKIRTANLSIDEIQIHPKWRSIDPRQIPRSINLMKNTKKIMFSETKFFFQKLIQNKKKSSLQIENNR